MIEGHDPRVNIAIQVLIRHFVSRVYNYAHRLIKLYVMKHLLCFNISRVYNYAQKLIKLYVMKHSYYVSTCLVWAVTMMLKVTSVWLCGFLWLVVDHSQCIRLLRQCHTRPKGCTKVCRCQG